MALPDLSRLSLRDEVRTGGAVGGPAVAEDAEGVGADLRVLFARAVLESITTLDEACRQLSQHNRFNSHGSDPVRMVNKKVRDAVEMALRMDGLAERLAERVMRAEMALGQGEGLPPGFTTWWSLLQEACRQLTILRHGGIPMDWYETFLVRCRTIVIAIVRRDGQWLQYAAEHLKRDREVVLAAVSQNEFALRYADEELMTKDKEVMLAAVSKYGMWLEYASAELQADKEVVLAAVSQNGYALGFASYKLKQDREVVLAAIAQNKLALRLAPFKVRRNPEMLKAAGLD